MKLLVLTFVAILGLVAVFVGSAQTAAPAYAGSEACIKCHRMKNKSLVEGFMASPLTHAFIPASMEGMIEGDFSKSPIAKSDVAFALCVKRREQSYVDKDLRLLPASWDNGKKQWVATPSVDAAKECLGCHAVGFNPEARTWVSMGVGCESCHGPQAAHAKSPLNSKLRPQKISELIPERQGMVCGSCHSVGRPKSGNAYLLGFKPGDDLDALWEQGEGEGGGGRAAFAQWRRSKHASIPCSQCHDPHNVSRLPYLLRQPVDALCGSCHAPQADMAKHAPTAKPGDTCATCHMPNRSHLFPKGAR